MKHSIYVFLYSRNVVLWLLLMLSQKTKQYLFISLKATVAITAFTVIYFRLTGNNTLSGQDFIALFTSSPLMRPLPLLIIFLLSVCNWLSEILKWKTLTSTTSEISLSESARQVLTAQTASLFTPYKIGEYAAKTVFFAKNQVKKVIFLNFLGNMAQLGTTLFFGIIGLFFFVQWHFPKWIEVYLVVVIFALFFMYLGNRFISFQSWKLKGFSIGRISGFVKSIPINDKIKIAGYSFLRYSFFSFQFCYLLVLLTPVSLGEVLPLVFLMYLLSSALPVLQLFDFAVKGGVAVLVLTTVPAQIVVSTVFLMWLLNAVFPALAGAYFVIAFDTKRMLKPVEE